MYKVNWLRQLGIQRADANYKRRVYRHGAINVCWQ